MIEFSFIFFSLVVCASAQGGPDDPHCVPITNSLCSRVGWRDGSVPNFLDQQDIRTINDEALQYLPLYDTGCSNAFLHFLCSIYYPPCFTSNVTGSEQTVVWPPCQELCDYVYCSCLDAVLNLGGEWPTRLLCPRFPSFRKGEACFPGNVDLMFFENLVLPMVSGRMLPSAKKCTDIGTAPNTTVTGSSPTTGSTPSVSTALCTIPNLAAPNGSGDRYSLSTYTGCSVPCDPKVYYGVHNAGTIIPVIVLVFSGLSLFISLVLLGAFLIDRSRFYYPERPVIYLTASFTALSSVLFLSGITSLANYPFACEEKVSVIYQRLPSESTSFKGIACVVVAILLYYATMATLVWWVVLTFTWLLATTLKWAAEAIAKFWIAYHMVGWGIPLIQTTLVLGIQWIDGDVGSGVCYVGNLDMVAKGVLVFSPTVLYLLTGYILFAVACISLFKIHSHMRKQNDLEKVAKLQKLIVHVLLFTALFSVPVLGLCIMYIYELAAEEGWERYVLCRYSPTLCSTPVDTPSPVAAAALKYILWLIPSSSLLVWVLSHKTIRSCGQLVWEGGPYHRQATLDRNGTLPRESTK